MIFGACSTDHRKQQRFVLVVHRFAFYLLQNTNWDPIATSFSVANMKLMFRKIVQNLLYIMY